MTVQNQKNSSNLIVFPILEFNPPKSYCIEYVLSYITATKTKQKRNNSIEH